MGSTACVGIQSDFDVAKNVNSFSLSSSSPRFLASVPNKAFFSFPYVSEQLSNPCLLCQDRQSKKIQKREDILKILLFFQHYKMLLFNPHRV